MLARENDTCVSLSSLSSGLFTASCIGREKRYIYIHVPCSLRTSPVSPGHFPLSGIAFVTTVHFFLKRDLGGISTSTVTVLCAVPGVVLVGFCSHIVTCFLFFFQFSAARELAAAYWLYLLSYKIYST